jgi:hypothetical protein
MKKWIIGSIVGAIIVFAWQFCSWTVCDLHKGEHKYTTAQNQILSTLKAANLDDGSYVMPNADPGATREQQAQAWKDSSGKPFAMIVYGKAANADMAAPMIWGFVIDILLVILLISILVRGGLPSFIGIVTGSIAVGVFSFLWEPYMMHNWYQVPWSSIIGHLYDAIGAWGLCGLWLGWWLRRPVNP